MLKRQWSAESNEKLSHLFIPNITATMIPKFAVEDRSSAELQPRFLRLQWRNCPWAEHSDDDDDYYYDYDYYDVDDDDDPRNSSINFTRIRYLVKARSCCKQMHVVLVICDWLNIKCSGAGNLWLTEHQM